MQFSKNIDGSNQIHSTLLMYFAVQAMAAELSTGALVMFPTKGVVEKNNVGCHNKSNFTKSNWKNYICL
jgi:hypothetical protein